MQDTRGEGHGVIGRDRAIGFDLHGQFVIIKHLTFAGRLHVIGHFLDRRIDRVDRNEADGRIFGLVLVSRDIAFAGVDGQLDKQIGAVIKVADHVLFVENFDAVAFGDVTSGNNTRTFGIDRQALGAFDFHAQGNAFEVQDDVGDIFAHARNRGKLVQHVVNLDRCDGGALQARHQNAAQRVPEGQTKTAFQRFGNNGGLARRLIARFHVKLCRLDQFSPILMDHVSLHSCLCLMSEGGRRPRLKMTDWGRAKMRSPNQ